MTAYMNLLPAPTSARFVGKMHKLKTEIDKKKEEVGKSSIAPTTETIAETKETESVSNTPRGSPSEFPTASRVVGKVKIGEL